MYSELPCGGAMYCRVAMCGGLLPVVQSHTFLCWVDVLCCEGYSGIWEIGASSYCALLMWFFCLAD